MERDRTTDCNGMKRGQDRLRAWLLAGASAAALLAPGPALGQVSADERVYRREALAHAHAVEAAWRRLETYILDESAGAAGWTGAVPPAAIGWQAGWTVRGLEARYCGGTLLVYLAPEELKGVGRDHRAVHVAPHAYAGNGETPVLHWLENGAAQGGVGRASVALPACLSEAAAGGPLPTGRAALAGEVRDPYRHTTERVARERKEEDCGAGEHGEGRTLIREATQVFNGRGEAVGDPAHGPWQVSIDLCRADYSQWEHYTLACHWEAGPPHNRRMEGREVWRRLKTVTSEGESLGAPEFVSTSCWTGGALPPAPVPAVSETGSEETKSGNCPAGYTGSLGYRRTVTMRSTLFPWDAAPVTQTVTGAWILDSDDCVPEIEPDWGDPEVPDPDGQGGDPGGGLGAPCSDSCDPSPYDIPGGGTDACSIYSSSFGDMSGADVGGSDDGGCFLTTAVAERRGEADDGPTLSALRRFRDGYMTRTAERKAMVAEYYATAPRIVSAIPSWHPDWDWIGARIDAAVAAIAASEDDEAFRIYAAMMRRLEARWPADGGANHDGGRP